MGQRELTDPDAAPAPYYIGTDGLRAGSAMAYGPKSIFIINHRGTIGSNDAD